MRLGGLKLPDAVAVSPLVRSAGGGLTGSLGEPPWPRGPGGGPGPGAIAAYKRDGVICLRAAFESDWLAVAARIANFRPLALATEIRSGRQTGRC